MNIMNNIKSVLPSRVELIGILVGGGRTVRLDILLI